MLLINGARIESAGYEFGVLLPDGYLWECIGYSEAMTLADMQAGSKVMMRAIYQTDWMETIASDE